MDDTRGWYDLTVTTPTSYGVQLAGHVEDQFESITDPLIGAA